MDAGLARPEGRNTLSWPASNLRGVALNFFFAVKIKLILEKISAMITYLPREMFYTLITSQFLS